MEGENQGFLHFVTEKLDKKKNGTSKNIESFIDQNGFVTATIYHYKLQKQIHYHCTTAQCEIEAMIQNARNELRDSQANLKIQRTTAKVVDESQRIIRKNEVESCLRNGAPIIAQHIQGLQNNYAKRAHNHLLHYLDYVQRNPVIGKQDSQAQGILALPTPPTRPMEEVD
eukprot:PhF_6_TR38243/c0_g1_i1/m.57093